MFLLTFLDQCVAKRKALKPLDDTYKLQIAILTTRHGARTPLQKFLPSTHVGFWQCDDEDAFGTRIEAEKSQEEYIQF